MILSLGLALGSACGAPEAGSARSPSHSPSHSDEPSHPDEPTAVGDRPSAPASPVTIRVVNDTGSAVVLDRSFGPAGPIGVAWLDGDLDPSIDLDTQDDARTGGWLATCQCACGGEPCPECEAPETVHVTLEPGDTYELPWSGRLRRQEEHPSDGACWSRIDPPRGRFAFTACTTEGRCGRVEATLPTRAPIEIRLSRAGGAASCDELRPRAAAMARARLLDQLRLVLRGRSIARCPVVAPCVAPDALEGAMRAARGEACSLLVIPRGPQLEVRAFLPLPLGTNGGESYAHFYDPDATHLVRARYEQ